MQKELLEKVLLIDKLDFTSPKYTREDREKQNDNVCWGIISIILSKNNNPKFKTAYQNTYHISDNNIICINKILNVIIEYYKL